MKKLLALLLSICVIGCNSNNNFDNDSVTCTVIFQVDGQVYDMVIVKYGETAVLSKEHPKKEGNLFIGWDKPLDDIKVNTTVNAVWEKEKYN